MENIIIGIDISSKTLDICVKQLQSIEHFTIENTQKAIHEFFRPFTKQKVVVAMENTGRYNWNLYEVLESTDWRVYVINPLHLIKSLGFVRGKNDKIDAYRIAVFIEKNQKENVQWRPSPKPIKQLKVLITERDSRIKMKRSLKKQQHDYKLMKTIGLDKDLLNLNQEIIQRVENQIAVIEKRIQQIIEDNKSLKEQSKLIKSVPGVGNVLSWYMLAKTEGFTKITEPRKMACFSGVVPFEHQSGSSIYRKPKVSFYADKSIKSILHLGALSAIRLENDLGNYYRRKVSEGKNKMSVLNAVRNKIIHRIFAVIKNQTIYKNNLVLS
ncbi:IS110 family transposase [Mariniflexile sp. HNIBRBA6329]|uniref:IS110 family transposase n=1 Tax=Mariniflexile sp. HNIBRBA6329 TaxID=3373088 RepID=UPI0037455C60